MTFPMKSDGVLEDLGHKFLANCKSDDEAVTRSCSDRITANIEACQGEDVPAVFETKDQYKSVGLKSLQCIAPNLICKGVEVKDGAECDAVAAHKP